MPFLSLIGVALFQLSAETAGAVLPSLASSVTGNLAHDLTKLGFRSVIERVSLGEISANHNLRRTALRATAALVVSITTGDSRPVPPHRDRQV